MQTNKNPNAQQKHKKRMHQTGHSLNFAARVCVEGKRQKNGQLNHQIAPKIHIAQGNFARTGQDACGEVKICEVRGQKKGFW